MNVLETLKSSLLWKLHKTQFNQNSVFALSSVTIMVMVLKHSHSSERKRLYCFMVSSLIIQTIVCALGFLFPSNISSHLFIYVSSFFLNYCFVIIAKIYPMKNSDCINLGTIFASSKYIWGIYFSS